MGVVLVARCTKGQAPQPCRQQKARPRERPGLIGRSRVIRTLDPLLPKQVRYQAALYSVMDRRPKGLAMRRVIPALTLPFKRFHKRIIRGSLIIAKHP